MKKLFYFIALCMFVGCSVDMDINETPTIDGGAKVFTASLSPATTKTYVDEQLHLYWTKGDMLSIFSSTLNEKYAFDGNTGDNSATFSKINTGFGYGNALPRNYGVYPYSSEAKISNEGVLSVVLPAKQSYAENSFGVNANTMVAVTESSDDCFLSLKSVGGFLKLRLYGEGVTVKKVRLQGNNSEKIAGAATVVAEYDAEPITTMSVDATTVISLNCGEGVALGNANEVKDFWIVVPPTVFEGGFTVTVVDNNNMAFKQVSNNKQEILRNTVLAMPAIEVVPTEPDTYEDDEEVTPTAQPNNEIWYTSTDGRHVIPNVKSDTFGANIEEFVYEDGKGIIKFDGAVSYIGEYAFGSCDALVSISLPESVTVIGIGAFSSCNRLEEISLPSNLTTIKFEAFYGCASLKSIILPESLTYLESDSFYNSGLESIVIPESVKFLPGAFCGCHELTSVTLSEGLLSLDGTFQDCSSLSNISVPDTVLSIGYGTFSGAAISEIICPPKVPYIANNAFSGCPNLTSVVIPEHVKTINQYAFAYCENLTSITIHEGVEHIGLGAFKYCSSLTELVIPNGTTLAHEDVMIWGDGTVETRTINPLEGCSSLTKVSLGSGVTAVCEKMFYNLNELVEVTLGENVATIGSSAFTSCEKLAKVTCLAVTPPTVGDTMFSSNYVPYIYVPAESVELYKAASGWSSYAAKIFAIGSEGTENEGTELEYTALYGVVMVDGAEGTYNIKNAYVVATNAKGFVITDSSCYDGMGMGADCLGMYVYHTGDIPTVGSVINISGTASVYQGLLRFENGATITYTGDTHEVNNMAYALVEGYTLCWEYTGVLSKNSSYYNVTITDAFGNTQMASIASPTDEMKTTLDALVGETIRVLGYYIGTATSGGTQYIQTMAVEVDTLSPSSL